MKNKIVNYLIALTIFFSINLVLADELEITSPNAICIDSLSGKVLYQKGETQKISIASITKLMTAVVCVENIDSVDTTVTVDMASIKEYLDPEFAVAGITNGEILTYYDLLCTTLIPSGADSATCIAINTFGDYDTFIQKMNEKAQELGMENTHFSNPIGYDEEDNYSTTLDITKLLKYVLQNDILKGIISLDTYTTTDGKITCSSTFKRAANVYGLSIEKIRGGKTGTTGMAGICLASFSIDEDREILAVVTGAPMFSSLPYNVIDTEKIFEYVEEKYNYLNIINSGEELLVLKTLYTKEDNVVYYMDENIPLYLTQVDKEKLQIEYSGIEVVNAWIKPGTKLGDLTIYYDGEEVYSKEIMLEQKLEFSFRKWIKVHYLKVVFVSIVLVLIFGIIIVGKKNKKNRKKNKKKKR